MLLKYLLILGVVITVVCVADTISPIPSDFGFASAAAKGAAPTAITAGASPYTWTNTNGVNTQVFMSGGTVSAIAYNGGAISGTLAGTVTVILQPGETVTVTYAVAPVIFKFKKF